MMTDGRRRIGVVEDDAAVCRFFCDAIGGAGDLELAFAAASLEEARAGAGRGTPELCLVDLGLPDGSGVEFIRDLKKSPGAKALVTTVFGDRKTVLTALKAGADGYILKSMDPENIVSHVRATLDGFTPMSPQVATYLLELLKPVREAPAEPREALTEREEEILSVFCRGLSYQETAAALGIGVNTVRDHVRRIYAKLKVHSRAEAVYEAQSLGLVDKT
jgi:DNA-binding NarL/FixJ family response regulator